MNPDYTEANAQKITKVFGGFEGDKYLERARRGACARRTLRPRHCGILGVSAAATHSRTAADNQRAHGGRCAAPACNPTRADSAINPCRTHSDHAHRSFRYLGRLRTPSQDPESLAPFAPWGQTCIPARGLRIWRI